jgi:hypothetical protein
MHRRRLTINRDNSTITFGARFQQRAWNEIPKGRLVYYPAERDELRMDVRIVIASLPAQLQRICVALMKFGVSEAARRLAITLPVAKYRIRLIRERFVAAGVPL